MNRTVRRTTAVFFTVLLVHTACGKDEALHQDARWQLGTADMMAETLRAGLLEQDIPAPQVDAAVFACEQALSGDSANLLDAFMNTVVPLLPKLGQKIAQINASPSSIGDDPFLGFATPIRNQARLWAGRELVRSRLFDEALPLLQSLEPIDVVAPTELLFYRGVCFHTLLKKDDAIDDLTMLLEHSDRIPRRFARTAELMLADIEPLKEDSLDEIARMMNDVSRRLDLGRSDEPVVDREQQIIDKLDKMIDKMEEEEKQRQQQQQQQQSSGGSQGGDKMKPMQDSQIAGGNGAGDVDRKKLGDRNGWGDLPAAERQDALQRISQDLPTHYREAIEAYFRKLATEKR